MSGAHSTHQNNHSQLTVESLSLKQLDYWMYQHASQLLNEAANQQCFLDGYERGRFHFSSDSALLADLMHQYAINIQQLAGEWLASNTQASIYGSTPTEAACRLVVKLTFGQHLPANKTP